MSKIAVIYWSGTGNTQAMAEAVAAGAKEAGAEADMLSCADVSGSVDLNDLAVLQQYLAGWNIRPGENR